MLDPAVALSAADRRVHEMLDAGRASGLGDVRALPHIPFDADREVLDAVDAVHPLHRPLQAGGVVHVAGDELDAVIRETPRADRPRVSRQRRDGHAAGA